MVDWICRHTCSTCIFRVQYHNEALHKYPHPQRTMFSFCRGTMEFGRHQFVHRSKSGNIIWNGLGVKWRVKWFYFSSFTNSLWQPTNSFPCGTAKECWSPSAQPPGPFFLPHWRSPPNLTKMIPRCNDYGNRKMTGSQTCKAMWPCLLCRPCPLLGAKPLPLGLSRQSKFMGIGIQEITPYHEELQNKVRQSVWFVIKDPVGRRGSWVWFVFLPWKSITLLLYWQTYTLQRVLTM